MSDTGTLVYVVDDDVSAREGVARLICSAGLSAKTFASGEEFLATERCKIPGCLILDVNLPGLNGLDLQHEIAESDTEVPIIFLTGYGDIPMSVRAVKAGAANFLTKPVDDEELLKAVRQALERSRIVLAHEAEMQELRGRYALLTPREKHVMALVVSGLLNKQVGGELGISESTVKAHRGQVMQKMKANSLADVVKMAEKLGLTERPEKQTV
jgi:FixJ family two-component response regulator